MSGDYQASQGQSQAFVERLRSFVEPLLVANRISRLTNGWYGHFSRRWKPSSPWRQASEQVAEGESRAETVYVG